MTQRLTRRQLLKVIAAGAATAALSPRLHARARYPTALPMPPRPGDGSTAWVWMGRIIHRTVFYEKADTSSERLSVLGRDESVRLIGQLRAPYSAHNDLWYRTVLGYVPSAWVLPVRVFPPQPFIADVGDWGIWGQVSQIYTAARVAPDVNAAQKYRIYGGTVYHVVDTAQDDAGSGWYKIVDDYPPGQISYQWVLARDMRRIPHEEMAPLHPFVGDKRMEADLSAQRLTCYEGDEIVFTTPFASGLAGETSTVTGHKCILLKQASRHMSNVPYEGMDEEDQPPPDDIFDLPGVPWNLFFDLNGTAIHGTYWHNDFGIRRSHGCLNVPIEAARWLYRWVHPIGGYEDSFVQSDCRVGTPLHVF